MNISYDYYRIFYYVAKCGSISKAAKLLLNNQPNLTRTIKSLEGQLGCPLFLRTRHGMRLTADGETLYAHMRIAFEHIEAAENELTQSTNLENGSVFIAASEVALRCLLLPVLKKYRELYPGIHIRISNHSTPQAVAALKDGTADFAVVTTPTDAEAPLKKVDLYSFREVLVGGKTFTALGSQELSLAEVQNYPFICLGRETQTWKFYQQIFEKYGLELSPDTEVATTDQILPLVKNELGMAFLPEAMAREAIEKGEIVELSLRENVPQRSVCMVYDRQHPLSAAAKELKSRMRQSAAAVSDRI